MVPFSKVQSGDLICTFMGSNVPYILREIDDEYCLIGEAHVQGSWMGRQSTRWTLPNPIYGGLHFSEDAMTKPRKDNEYHILA